MKEKDLEWTGERLTTVKTNEIAVHHLHRYALAIEVCKGKRVLDIASGEGYGANLLCKVAENVIGVDISKEAVEFAKSKYNAPNLLYKEGSADKIPLDDSTVDIVVSFETIEHHDKHEEMFMEIKRVLRPGGILIMSSPDKLNYSDVPKFKNPFHIKELYREEFKNLVLKYFKHQKMFYQSITYSSVIVPEDGIGVNFKEFSGDFNQINKHSSLTKPVYNLSIASDSDLPTLLGSSIFDALHILPSNSSIYNSKTYKLGHFMTFPLRMLRKIFK